MFEAMRRRNGKEELPGPISYAFAILIMSGVAIIATPWIVALVARYCWFVWKCFF